MADQRAGGQNTTFFQKLRDGEQLWAWKFGLRGSICILDIIAIGCTGWLISSITSNYLHAFGDFEASWLYPFLLIGVMLPALFFLRRLLMFRKPGVCVIHLVSHLYLSPLSNSSSPTCTSGYRSRNRSRPLAWLYCDWSACPLRYSQSCIFRLRSEISRRP